MTKQGRPAGLLANPDAFADSLDGRPQRWLADECGISVSFLSELLSGRKGTSEEQARNLAAVLKKRPGTLFPELAAFRVEARVFTISGFGEM